MINYRLSLICSTLITVLLVAGCGGGGQSDQNQTNQGQSDQNQQASLSFNNFASAKTLITKSDLIEPVATQASLPADSGSFVAAKVSSDPSDALFNYRIVTAETAEKLRKTGTTGESQGKTNLLVVDQDGKTHLAIDTDQTIKILYTVASPDGKSVYVALDMHHGDSHAVIANNNCALYQVDTADSSHRCVKEGLYVNSINDNYRKNISGDQKPIQFDDANNMYFSASTYTARVDEYCEWYEGDECASWYNEAWIESYHDWRPRIYKQHASTNEVTAMTQDNQEVEFFVALSSGEVVIQSRNADSYKAQLYLVQQDAQVIDLSGQNWGVDFFTVDSGNTVIFGEHNWSSNNGKDGVRFARPRSQGGAEWASLDTSLFANRDNDGGWFDAKPKRVLIGDNGRIYGVFQGQEYDADTDKSVQVLSVYQILPYDPIPKLKLPLDSNADWWDWMDETPFQVAKGYIYYKESTDSVEYYGSSDVIRMRNLDTRETLTFLQPLNENDGRYDLYTWKISGTVLHFSALNKVNNTVVTGEIDTLKVRKAEGDEELADADAITLYNLASAQGAVSAVQDLEVLTPKKPDQDTGSSPVVTQVHQDINNPYSMSVDFSKYMHHGSVDGALTITSSEPEEGPDQNGVIPALKVWIHKTLHLIPNLNGLGTAKTPAPMSLGKTYTLNLADTIVDSYGWNLSQADSQQPYPVKIRPASGFYIDKLPEDLDVNDTVATDNILRYAGNSDDSVSGSTVNLGKLPSPHFRVEFSQKIGSNWQGPRWIIYNEPQQSSQSDSNSTTFDLQMSSYHTYINYNFTQDSGFSYNHSGHNVNLSELVSEMWNRYRLDFYGSNFKMYYLGDEGTFVEVASYDNLTDFSSYLGLDNRHLRLQVSDIAAFDNIKVTALNDDGTVSTDQPSDTYQENFEDLDKNTPPDIYKSGGQEAKD